MKKILINITIIIMSIIIPSNVYALATTTATEPIDTTKNGHLTLKYSYDDYNFDDTTVSIYYIASVTSDFQYQLSSTYANYSIEVNGIKTNQDWNSLEQTLNAYIEADSIKATLSKVITNNTIKLENLKPGLYFIKTNKIDTKDYTLLFDEFLISIPNLNEDGTWNYNVTVNPKAEEYTPKYEKIKYTTLKEWIDSGKKRPESIDIDIYEDGILVESTKLSNDNNWTYEWITDDDGSNWTVVERNIPEGYKVSILNQKRNFIIINKDSNYQEENPKTLDDIKLYFYIFMGSLIGLILLAISIFKNNKNN